MNKQSTRIISIEGNIGTGKSTFIRELQNKVGSDETIIFLQEPVDVWNSIKDENGKSILERYYQDQHTFAFPFQMMAYISRISLLRNAMKKNPKVIITERSVMTDKMVFASMLKQDKKIDDIGYSIYCKWFDEFKQDLPEFTYVYLRCDPTISSKRVIKRNRTGETIPLEYLKTCHEYHDKWLLHAKNSSEVRKTAALCLAANSDMNVNPDAMQISINSVLELIYNKPNKYLVAPISNTHDYLLQFDGASRGNPGRSATGYIIYNYDNQIKTNEIEKNGHYLNTGLYTNNYAEYMALIKGLEKIISLRLPVNKLYIEGDSLLVVNQVKGDWNISSKSLTPLQNKAVSLLKNITQAFSLKHIKRKDNAVADQLANIALDNSIVSFDNVERPL